MKAVFYEEGDYCVVCDRVNSSSCFDNPRIEGPEGMEVPQRILDNNVALSRLLSRHNYFEALVDFIPYGLESNSIFLTDIFVGKGTDCIYGVTPEGKMVELLSHHKRIDLFSVIDAPSSSVLSDYQGCYSNQHLNLRDCIGYYPFSFAFEDIAALQEEEASCSFYSYLNDWVNNRPTLQEINFGVTIDEMLNCIDKSIDWRKLFGALYYNKEGYKDATDIPLIQQKVLTVVDPAYLPYYIYIMNLVLLHKEDSETRELLYNVRYILAHNMR